MTSTACRRSSTVDRSPHLHMFSVFTVKVFHQSKRHGISDPVCVPGGGSSLSTKVLRSVFIRSRHRQTVMS